MPVFRYALQTLVPKEHPEELLLSNWESMNSSIFEA